MYPTNSDPVYGNFIHDQVKEMQRQGLKVKVICPIPIVPFPLHVLNKKWRIYSKIPKKTIYDGVEVYHPRYTLLPKSILFHLSGHSAYLAIRKLARTLYQEYPFDLIHTHVALPSGYVGTKLAKIYKVPCMLTIHGKDLQTTVHINHKCQKTIRSILEKTESIILVSEKLKRRITELFPNVLSKCEVIPNGVNIILNQNKPLLIKQQTYILSVGNLYQSKGTEINLLAFKEITRDFPECSYLIIGEGPEKDHLKRLAKELNIEDKVIFLGKVPHNEVLAYMKSCTIFSLPSWMEAFGIVYIEAMSLGKPVIACEGEGISDTIEHFKTGFLIPPNNVETLVETFTLLLSNAQLRTEVGNNAKQLASTTFSWKKNVLHYKHIFNKIVG